MDDLRPDARPGELALEPLAQVGVRTVPVSGQLAEQRADRRNALAPFLPDEATLGRFPGRCVREAAGQPF
jgi:hypothetical protein